MEDLDQSQDLLSITGEGGGLALIHLLVILRITALGHHWGPIITQAMIGKDGPIEILGNIVIDTEDEIQIDHLIIVHLLQEETEVGV